MFGLFARAVSFRAQTGQTGRPCIELPGVEAGREKAVLHALKGMGRVRIRSRSNDFGHVTFEFRAGVNSYSLHGHGAGAYIRGESGGEEIATMLGFMRKSRRFKELQIKPSK